MPACPGPRRDREQAAQAVARLEAQLAELKEKPVEVAVGDRGGPGGSGEGPGGGRGRDAGQTGQGPGGQKAGRGQTEDRRGGPGTGPAPAGGAGPGGEKGRPGGRTRIWLQFEVLFDQTKDTVNRMHGILLKVRSQDEDAAGRLSKALAALAEAVRRCAE